MRIRLLAVALSIMDFGCQHGNQQSLVAENAILAKMRFEENDPPVVGADIAEFEKEIGFQLPADYREFLLTHNGGVPHPSDFKQQIGDEVIVNWVQRFYSLGREGDLRLEWRDAERLELPSGWLPIGIDMAGENLCVCLMTRDYGAVAATDGYVEHLGRPPELRRLAGSFTEFLRMLYDQKALEPVDAVYELSASGTKQDLLNYLARGGRMTDTTRFGSTVTQSAAAHGNLDLLKACLEQGGDITRCLTLAFRNHRWETMRLLVETGADVNEVDPKTGETPIESIKGYYANVSEGMEAMAYLRRHGAKK